MDKKVSRLKSYKSNENGFTSNKDRTPESSYSSRTDDNAQGSRSDDNRSGAIEAALKELKQKMNKTK